MTESECYLTKAHESLASAAADVAAGRYNSAVNRAYYAAFQAAVAALVNENIRPETGNWQHRFVLSQFSGKLVRRRKRLPSDLPSVLDRLFRTRVLGDYEPVGVSSRQAGKALQSAQRFVEEVDGMMKLQSFREATAEYESDARAGQERLADAERLVSELQAEISKAVPGVDYSVIRLGPADYRMYAFVETETEREAVEEALGSRTVDILCEHDIWIVVIILLREQASV